MPGLITAPTRSAVKENTRKKTNSKISENKNFVAKTEYQNLKAPSSNVKKQSDKNYTNLLFPNYTAVGFFK